MIQVGPIGLVVMLACFVLLAWLLWRLMYVTIPAVLAIRDMAEKRRRVEADGSHRSR